LRHWNVWQLLGPFEDRGEARCAAIDQVPDLDQLGLVLSAKFERPAADDSGEVDVGHAEIVVVGLDVAVDVRRDAGQDRCSST